MVHRGFGTARITYPRTVQLSPADPMTTAILPDELLEVPGVVSRPIRLGESVAQAEATLIALMQQRMANPFDLGLRDAEHEAFSRYVLAKLGPVLGRAVVAASVPFYSGSKLLIQALGGMRGATPASLREIAAGLRPLVKAGPTIVGYASVGVWPGAVMATASQCADYVKSHGGRPGGCQAVYSDGTRGPVISMAAPPTRAPQILKAPLWVHPQAQSGFRLGYYPNLGQDAVAPSAAPYSLGGVPGWVWYVVLGGAAYLVLYSLFFRGGKPAAPKVRTVTRTTF